MAEKEKGREASCPDPPKPWTIVTYWGMVALKILCPKELQHWNPGLLSRKFRQLSRTLGKDLSPPI
jgi:hypothetical protein